jgi:hypothetical protein
MVSPARGNDFTFLRVGDRYTKIPILNPAMPYRSANSLPHRERIQRNLNVRLKVQTALVAGAATMNEGAGAVEGAHI